MRVQYAISLILLVCAFISEEVHNLFSNYSTEKVYGFPFSQQKESIQWYAYDLGNAISPALIAIIILYAFKRFGKNMRDVAIVYLIYRLAEIAAFLLANKQVGYSMMLSLVGISLYLIVKKWKNN